jgi:hypothetical protein
LVRSVTAFLREYVNDRRRVLRRGSRYGARLPFIISLLGVEPDSAESRPGAPALVGQTRDLSESGMTLLLPSVRVGGSYLTDGENYLGIQLELPSGRVAMLALSVRFEQLPEKEDGCGYLLGVRIIKMQEGERELYTTFLNTLRSTERRARERRRAQSTSLAGQHGTAQGSTWENLTPTSISMAFEKFLREQTHLRKS